MTHIIKIQNLSSGDVVAFQNSFIQNYSFKKNLNWDVTNTIGRMDPIKTFKNTESKIDISFTVINPHSNILHHKMSESSLSYEREADVETFFENPKVKNVNTGVYSYNSNINVISKLLYPSYEKSSNGVTLHMQSAPVLRVSIYSSSNKEINIFDGYATINALDTNLKAEDVSSPSGRTFSSLEFSILFDVIHANESDVSSRITQKQVTEQDIIEPQTQKKSFENSQAGAGFGLKMLRSESSGIENAGGLFYRGSDPITPSEIEEYRNDRLK